VLPSVGVQVPPLLPIMFKRKKSFCSTCPLRDASCLAGQCQIKHCILCYWQVKIGFLKALSAGESRLQCIAPKLADPATGKPKHTCDICRSYDHYCGSAGKYFLHKEMASVMKASEDV
jgi:hypothetical protein